MIIGKKSFEERALLDNYMAVVDEVLKAKPSSAKGRYIHSLVRVLDDGPGCADRSDEAQGTGGRLPVG